MQRLGSLLLNKGHINREQLEFCLRVQKSNGGARIGQVLKHYNFVTDINISQALASQVGWEFFSGEYILNKDMFVRFGCEFFKEKVIFPLESSRGIVFVLTHTDDTKTTDFIQSTIGSNVLFVLGLESHVRKALESNLKDDMLFPNNKDDLLQWFEDLLQRAVIECATDIHIEPSQKAIEIRFRIDGILQFHDSLHLSQLSRLVNIIFNKADVTISDFHHCHDARFSKNCLNRSIDIRVSHIPTVHGSSLVLRLLDKGKTALALTDLGYDLRHWELIEENLIKPEGITLVVGPTGCGKTTTLYAMLNFLKDISRKIVTIEDPVEVLLPLTTQLQIQEQQGITFGESVRAFLRHDPDILLIGEIRDRETAQEAMRASMTGHKVFATLHTNRAQDALLRLSDLGADSHYIANCLNLVIAQRLVRKLCPFCKETKITHKKEWKNFYHKYFHKEEQSICMAVGCEYCNKGYLGRTIVAEILSLKEETQQAIAQKDWVYLKKELVNSRGYIGFEEDAKRLILNGTTSLDEIVRNLG